MNRSKSIWEMLGEFFREAAVLVLIFGFFAIDKEGNISSWVAYWNFGLCVGFFVIGCIFEKLK